MITRADLFYQGDMIVGSAFVFWSSTDPAVALISACLPATPPVFASVWKGIKNSVVRSTKASNRLGTLISAKKIGGDNRAKSEDEIAMMPMGLEGERLP